MDPLPLSDALIKEVSGMASFTGNSQTSGTGRSGGVEDLLTLQLHSLRCFSCWRTSGGALLGGK